MGCFRGFVKSKLMVLELSCQLYLPDKGHSNGMPFDEVNIIYVMNMA